ncbi:hypothetical protein [Paraburkholderia sp. GAS42]|jgi:hypothetical protein|uniref:hypothetical protein n=1 Tax=Paraburkholderia sp. GAS42 TaxID=3035135 RepID=UPI003D1CD466
MEKPESARIDATAAIAGRARTAEAGLAVNMRAGYTRFMTPGSRVFTLDYPWKKGRFKRQI